MLIRRARSHPHASDSDTSLPKTPTQRTNPVQLGVDVSAANRYSMVSPLASPASESNTRDSESSFCVSPIEETDGSPGYGREDSRTSGIVGLSDRASASPSPPSTALPVPKTVQFAPNEDTHPTRWDDFSGEPTTNNLGKASQVNPRNNTFHKVSGSHAANFLHWGREQLQSKKKLAKARNRISSLPAPTQKETRGQAPSQVSSSGENSNSHTEPAPQLHRLGFVPTVVTTISAGSPPPLPDKPATEHDSRSNRQDQQDSKFDTAIASMMQPVQPSHPYGATKATANATTGHDSPGNSPSGSPRGSTSLGAYSNDDLISIMSRRRPVVPIAMPTSQKPVRKPTPLQAATQAAQEPELAPLPPPVEPPKDAMGRITSLETRRDELKKRRFNLETVIHELTRVIQPGSITYDLAAKAEVKKSVQSIENEIAEIKKEEHDLGMKVSRAWRRLDERENHGDGSNLWVKRVTS